MKQDKEYIIAISGYEGIECVFGPFTQEEAQEFGMQLKNEAPGRDNHDCPECMSNESGWCQKHAEEDVYLRDTYDIYTWFSPQQVCAMKAESNWKSMQCVCQQDFNFPKQEAWLR